MNLKLSFLIALIASGLLLTSWEAHWRNQGIQPEYEDTKALWAVQRAKVESLGPDDVVLTGSSRVLFDVQVHVWEEQTGRQPIQLASAGSNPIPAFHDLVEHSDYIGTVVVGVTPGLFFASTDPKDFGWNRMQSRVEHYHDRTYAQRLNHWLDMPLQANLAFLRNDDEDWTDDLDMKSLLFGVRWGDRGGPFFPPFYRFQDIDLDRNVAMKDKTVKDTAFAGTIINAWKAFMSAGGPPPDVEGTTAYFLADLEKFKARGGKVILVRCPSSAGLRHGEAEFLSRDKFWQYLVDKAQVPAYHFEDYPELNQYFCPEWSHLSHPDAQTFTKDLTQILIKDGVISKTKETYEQNN